MWAEPMFDEWMKMSGTVAQRRSSWPSGSSWIVKRPMWIGAVASYFCAIDLISPSLSDMAMVKVLNVLPSS